MSLHTMEFLILVLVLVLVAAGLGVSFVPHMPRFPLNPDLVFVIFLPPLLYSSAWQTSWREFRFNMVSIALLAFGLVGFTVWGVAFTADHFITALDWKAGFLLGAVVLPTDAIAASSIARKVGLPLPPLIRGLKLAGAGPDCEENEVRRLVLLAALSFLEEKKVQADERSGHAVEDLLHRYQHKLKAVERWGSEGVGVGRGGG